MASSLASYRPWRVLGPALLLIAALTAWAFWPGQTHTPQLGLDLQGGTQVTLLPKASPGSDGSITEEQLGQAVTIIRQRVDGLGVAEAEVTVQGSGNNAAIIVSVPGSVPQERLVELVGRTAQLAFRAVESIANPERVDPNAPVEDPSESPTPSPRPRRPPRTPAPARRPAPPTRPPPRRPVPPPARRPPRAPRRASSSRETPVQAAANDTDFQDRALRLDCTLPANRAGGTPDDQDLWLATC